MTITIRKAQLQDAPGLAGLMRSIGWFHAMDGETPEQSQTRVLALLMQDLADASHSVYVAEDESGQLAGYCAAHWLPYLFLAGPEGFISELFVAEAARGAGAGGRLLEAVEAEARQRGCARLQLLNGRQRESYARGFYSKHGYQERELMASFVKKLL